MTVHPVYAKVGATFTFNTTIRTKDANDNEIDYDLTDNTGVFIEFRTPHGKQIRKTASKSTTSNELSYTDDPNNDPVLTVSGSYEYVGVATFADKTVIASNADFILVEDQ